MVEFVGGGCRDIQPKGDQRNVREGSGCRQNLCLLLAPTALTSLREQGCVIIPVTCKVFVDGTSVPGIAFFPESITKFVNMKRDNPSKRIAVINSP